MEPGTVNDMERLWQPVSLGRMTLPNRLAMAPMTRSRSTPSGTPTELNAEYYAQRASFGLIVSEGTQPSDDGHGYLLTPGIYTEEHIAGWRLVTDRVHAAGGRLFIQLMHVGRVSHPDNTRHHRQPVGPSAVRPAGKMMTAKGLQDLPEPREFTRADIDRTVADYRHAARTAIAAGADGVELHAANGYLIHEFLSDNANLRTDSYGGSIENRIRFAVEVAAAVAEEIGADRTGLRLSPGNKFNDIVEAAPAPLYRALVVELARLRLAYLHIIQAGDDALLRWTRPNWPTALIVNRPGRPRERIAMDVDEGLADMASVATFALANPDLVARLKAGAPLNEADRATFYGGSERGYTDYPTLAGAARPTL
jgi:N-ethylmaleimide reductase